MQAAPERRQAAREIREAAARKSTMTMKPRLPEDRPENLVELYSKGLQRRSDGDTGLPTEGAFRNFTNVIDRAYLRTSAKDIEEDFTSIEAEAKRNGLAQPSSELSPGCLGPRRKARRQE